MPRGVPKNGYRMTSKRKRLGRAAGFVPGKAQVMAEEVPAISTETDAEIEAYHLPSLTRRALFVEVL